MTKDQTSNSVVCSNRIQNNTTTVCENTLIIHTHNNHILHIRIINQTLSLPNCFVDAVLNYSPFLNGGAKNLNKVALISDSQQTAVVVFVLVDVFIYVYAAAAGVIVDFVDAVVDDLQLIINPTRDPYFSIFPYFSLISDKIFFMLRWSLTASKT